MASAERPTAYSQFEVILNASSFETKLNTDPYLFLPKGTYHLDNPLIINTEDSLFVHGSGRGLGGTTLKPINPSEPLFIVEQGSVVNFSNIRIEGLILHAGFLEQAEFVNVQFEQTKALDINGPGSFHLQNVLGSINKKADTFITLNHENASVTMVGGTINDPLVAHIHQKQGHLAVYGTSVQNNWGSADYIIETAHTKSHVIAGSRSEGSVSTKSVFLSVPETQQKVNVLLKGNAALGRDPLNPFSDQCRFVNYNGSGTVWALANTAGGFSNCFGSFSVFSKFEAQLVAINNFAFKDSLCETCPTRVFGFGNQYDYWNSTENAAPRKRFMSNAFSSNWAEAPRIPDNTVPDSITFPEADIRLPQFTDVKLDYGAVGDGITDDTASLQSAFDDACGTSIQLYFPPGEYLITAPLYYQHRDGGVCKQRPFGSMFVGAGSDKVLIVNSQLQSVIASEGMAVSSWQGLTFKTPSDIEPNIVINNGLPSFGIASQGNSFSDIVVDGGKCNIGFGTEGAQQDSENFIAHSLFKNAEFGVCSNHFNALANTVSNSTFDNVGTMFTTNGGTSYGWNLNIDGATDSFLKLTNCASCNYYFSDIVADSPHIVSYPGPSAVPFQTLFENIRLVNDNLSNIHDSCSAMGITFLNSHLSTSTIDLCPSGISVKSAAAIQSTVDWQNDDTSVTRFLWTY